MIGEQETGLITTAIISKVAHEDLSITTLDGKPARLAILDDAGNILAEGTAVAQEVHNVTINAFRTYARGQGFLRTFNVPPAQNNDHAKKAA